MTSMFNPLIWTRKKTQSRISTPKPDTETEVKRLNSAIQSFKKNSEQTQLNFRTFGDNVKTKLETIDTHFREQHQKEYACIEYIKSLLGCLETIQRKKEHDANSCKRSLYFPNLSTGDRMYDKQRIENELENLKHMLKNCRKKKEIITDLKQRLLKLEKVDSESLDKLTKDKVADLLKKVDKPVRIVKYVWEKEKGMYKEKKLVLKIEVPTLGKYHVGYKSMKEVQDFFSKGVYDTNYSFSTDNDLDDVHDIHDIFREFVREIIETVDRESKHISKEIGQVYNTYFSHFLRKDYDNVGVKEAVNESKYQIAGIGGAVSAGAAFIVEHIILGVIIATFPVFAYARKYYKNNKKQRNLTQGKLIYVTFALNILIFIVALGHARTNIKEKSKKQSPQNRNSGGHSSVSYKKNAIHYPKNTRGKYSLTSKRRQTTRQSKRLRQMNGGILLNQHQRGEFYEAIEEKISEFLFTNREDLFVPLINVLGFQLKEDRDKHTQLKQSIDELIGKEEKPNGDNDIIGRIKTRSASAGQLNTRRSSRQNGRIKTRSASAGQLKTRRRSSLTERPNNSRISSDKTAEENAKMEAEEAAQKEAEEKANKEAEEAAKKEALAKQTVTNNPMHASRVTKVQLLSPNGNNDDANADVLLDV